MGCAPQTNPHACVREAGLGFCVQWLLLPLHPAVLVVRRRREMHLLAPQSHNDVERMEHAALIRRSACAPMGTAACCAPLPLRAPLLLCSAAATALARLIRASACVEVASQGPAVLCLLPSSAAALAPLPHPPLPLVPPTRNSVAPTEHALRIRPSVRVRMDSAEPRVPLPQRAAAHATME
jgi:hypothetical protein